MNRKAFDRAIRIAGGQSSLAREVGVSRQYIHKVINTGVLSYKCAQKIEEVTKGKVTVKRLCPSNERGNKGMSP